MNGFQAEGSDPIVRGEIVERPETIATAIRIGNPAGWKGALKARDESMGHIGSVSDSDIMTAYRELALLEGVFCEPASAASVAGLMKRRRSGKDFSEKTVVCILTGTGLKDPDISAEIEPKSIGEYSADMDSVEKALFIA